MTDLENLKKTFQGLGFVDGPTGDSANRDEGKITPMPIDIPYQEHAASMARLAEGIYRDWQFANLEALSGGSITNVVIKAMLKEENTRAADAEALTKEWLRQLLVVAGHEVTTDDIIFQHATIVNASEIHNDLVALVREWIITPEIAVRVAPILIENGLVEDAKKANAAAALEMTEAALAEFERQMAESEAQGGGEV